jgi:hypothetical protein
LAAKRSKQPPDKRKVESVLSIVRMTASMSSYEQQDWVQNLLLAKRTTSSLLLLPREILYQIISYLAPDDFVSLSLSSYVQLQVMLQDIIPPISVAEWNRLEVNNSHSWHAIRSNRPGLHRMPAELLVEVLHSSPRSGQIRFSLAAWRILFGGNLVHQISDPALFRELRIAGMLALSLGLLSPDNNGDNISIAISGSQTAPTALL